jgi:hypothetical protein
MSVSPTVTFQQVPPKRPGEADIINGVKENATPTVPPHMPAAEEYMQIARLAVAASKMIPLLRVSIEFAVAGVPNIHTFACAREDIATGDLTVTDLGVGRTTITWATGKFPSPNTKPMVSCNRTGVAVGVANVLPIVNGVDIYTTDIAGAATDIPFTVAVF